MGDLFWAYIWDVQAYWAGAFGIFGWLFDSLFINVDIVLPWFWPERPGIFS